MPVSPTPSPALTMTATDWLLLLVLSALWGGSFYFAKIAVLEIPPLTLLFGRVAIAAAALALVTGALGGTMPRDRRTWWDFTVMATFNNVVPFALIFWGQIHISIGLASIFNATAPLFGVLIAHVMTHDDKLSAGRLIGLLAGFIGVVVLIGPDMLGELGTNVVAEFACLLGAASFGLGAVVSRRVRAHSPFVTATGQLTMSAALSLPLALFADGPFALTSASSRAIWAMAGLALLSSALAYLIYFRLIARAGATNALLSTFLIPVSAILLGIELLDEHLDLRQLVGMATIFIGIAAIDGRLARAVARMFRN